MDLFWVTWGVLVFILFMVWARNITMEVYGMAGELERLQVEVQETKDEVLKAVAYIADIKTKLDEAIASGNPVALSALSDELDALQTALKAVTVPAEPAPAPVV